MHGNNSLSPGGEIMGSWKRARSSLLIIGLMGSLAIAYAVFGASGSVAASPAAAQGAALPGTASLSGTVDSTAPFKAAQVFIRNVDKRILYMVYTNAGQFRAVALFPGNYEIKSSTKGLESDVQKLVLKAGESPKLKLSLHSVQGTSARTVVNALETNTESNSTVSIEQAYDQVYPPGPGREVAERTCIICHGENFLPGRPGNLAVWTARLDRMMGKALTDRAAASYAEGLLSYRASALRFSRADRDDLLAYLAKNFGPSAKPRAVRIDQEMPLDEAKLGKAMFIEYYLPPDPPGQGIHAPEFSKMQGGFAGRRVGQDVRFDQDGNVWPTDRGYPNRLVKLDPRTGEQKAYVLPDPKNGNHDVNIDRTGIIWLAEAEGAQPTAVKHLLGFDPKTEKVEYHIPMEPDKSGRDPTK